MINADVWSTGCETFVMTGKSHLFYVLPLFFLLTINLFTDYTPDTGELIGWSPDSSECQYEGEDLFLLINGGAEIYHEYGFKNVYTREYKNAKGKKINLEIYEMKNSSGAYGVYTFKTSGNGKQYSIGNDALMEDYYLNFWKGNFIVTLVGFDSETDTIEGLVEIAEAVDKKIKVAGKKPVLQGLLPGKNLIDSSTKYIKGNLGLFNNYEFSHRDIFKIKEGVIGDYGDFKLFIFKYNKKRESRNIFEDAGKDLQSNSKFRNFSHNNGSFSLTDRKGKVIHMKLFENYILVFLGTKKINPQVMIKEMENKIQRREM